MGNNVSVFIHALLLFPLASCTQVEQTTHLYRIRDGGRWGFINQKGKVVIAPQYDNCHYDFKEGLAPVQVSKKWGYIDKVGKFVIPPQFDYASSFDDGLATVSIGEPYKGEGKDGYIDRMGHFVLGPDEKYSGDFRGGLLRVETEGKVGYVNKMGEWVIAPTFKSAGPFCEGLASVEVDGKEGYINKKGEMVIPATFHCAGWFCEGLADVCDPKNRKWGFINTKGEHVIPPSFDRVEEFHEGLARVGMIETDSEGCKVLKWGYIDKSGKVVIPIQFDFAWEFSEGLAKVEMKKKWGFINREGVQVISCRYCFAEPFGNGLAMVNEGETGDEILSYIDRNGRYVWRPSDYREHLRAIVKRRNRTPSIKLFSERDSKERGLLVECARKVPASGENAGKVMIDIGNRLNEEVFVDVSGFDDLTFSLDYLGSWCSSGGEGTSEWEDRHLYKRLQIAPHNYSRMRVTGGLYLKNVNLKEWIGARGEVIVCIQGFYKNTGKPFDEDILLTVEIVE